MTATTGRLRIGSLGKRRQAMVRRWLDRAAEEMYAAPGIDKGFTAEETKLVRLTIDAITDQFLPGPESSKMVPLAECPDKTDKPVWNCSHPNGKCILCIPMTYKALREVAEENRRKI